MERFSELLQNLEDVPKSETFVCFTKIEDAAWFNNKIIPVYIALILRICIHLNYLTNMTPTRL